MNKKNNIIIGITGGIGSGKSFVANILRNKGYKVFDCDSQAKWLMTHDKMIIHDIIDVVGDKAYDIVQDENGNNKWLLNKSVIANFIFNDNNNSINNIVHPRLALFFKKWVKELNESIVFLESAILFDSGFDKLVDMSVLVFAEDSLRLYRACKRDGLSENEILVRMKHQMDQQTIMKRVDYVIYNNENDDLNLQISTFLNLIEKNCQ